MGIFKKALDIGVKSTDRTKEKKRIRILNVTSYISLVNISFFLLLDYVQGLLTFQKAVTLTIQLGMFTILLFLQYKRYVKLARIVLMVLVFAILFYHGNYAYRGFYGEYYYIIIPLVSLFFFDSKYIHYGLLVIAILAFYLPNLYYQNYPEPYFGYLNVAFLFVGLFLLVNFFKRENDTNERLLAKERDKVFKDKILLEKQQQDLKELNQFKTHFFTNISHEIRTPLTLLKGYTDRIEFQPSDVQNIQNMGVVRNQLEEIQNIVDSLLDMTRLDEKKLHLNIQYHNLKSILTRLSTDYERLFVDKGIEFSLIDKSPNIMVALDKNYFFKSIHNLLSNALKFTPQGGEVKIQIDYSEALKIAIVDNGLGIPKEDQEKVFERFFQSKNHITESVGSGIGLSFANSILDSHGFDMSLESIPGQETKFTVTIPKDCIKHEFNEPTSVLHHTQKEKLKETILIVEDNAEVRNYLKLVLQSYTILEASHGKEALEVLQHHKVSLIITDYMMPVMNGVELVKTLRSESNKTPIIVLTARNDDQGKLDMLRIGIDGYYTKPFIEEELLLKVEQCIHFYQQLTSFEKDISFMERNELSENGHDFYQQLIRHIETNISNKNFGVDHLAELMGLSRSSLFRKTRFNLGQTPNEVIKEARFQKARQLLAENPTMKKKALADAVGIYNVTYFYENLKNRFAIKSTDI